jgi:site-specific DNA recombinase
MIRAAIYARYSTDLQNDRSVEDQAELCRAYAERNGMIITEVYADRAQSGSSTLNRLGWQKLMRDADAKTFDVIIAEDIDRISRDESDYHSARKRLTFVGVKIHTAHGGEITGIEGSVRAMMGALFLENLAHKVRRGLTGVGAVPTATARSRESPASW